MENIETVVRERNRAYHQLETGKDGERPGEVVYNALGLTWWYKNDEHFVPKHLNTKWTRRFGFDHNEVREFKKLYREKKWNEKRKEKARERNQAIAILKKFPHVKLDLVQKKYPGVNVDRVLRSGGARGHFEAK